MKYDKFEFDPYTLPDVRVTDNYNFPHHFRSAWDDFTKNIPVWENRLKEFKGKSDLTFLELGTAQGRATVWLLEEILTEENCKILTVDNKIEQIATCNGNSLLNFFYENIEKDNLGEEYIDLKNQEWWPHRENAEIRYNVINNLKPYIDNNKCDFYNENTSNFFKSLATAIGLKPVFDFIYVDASHNPENVIFDAVNSFRYLKTGGVMIFDDYAWGDCKIGIDSFLNTHKSYYTDLIVDTQVTIRKSKDLE